MVFKPFSHLARQSFTKAFTHGYAPSLVAASQSSYASSTTFNQIASHPAKFARTTQLQNAFQNASSSSGAGAKASQANSGSSDFGLAAYYAAWQHAQQTGDDNDWRQFHAKRRIEWKLSSTEAEVEGADTDKHSVSESFRSPRLAKVTLNDDVSAHVDEAVARELQIQEEQAKAEEEESASRDETASAPELTSAEEVAADIAAGKSHVASEAVVELLSSQKFSEIPAAFEALLKEGLTPTVRAYNALLMSAVKLHVDAAQAIPKALDVYSDMLRRRVMPDEETYKILVQLFVTRAHDAINAKKLLEEQRVRYGGMEEPGKFMLQSSELERDIVAEDHSLAIAVKLFNTATDRHANLVFPLEIYSRLIYACAGEGLVEAMIRIYEHMELQKVVPHASIFPAMIDAFAATGDLKSAVECYNEYRSLAISDDEGVFSVVDRLDAQVYAAVVRAYLSCGKEDGALRFLNRIQSSFDDLTENRAVRKQAVESVIVDEALVEHSLRTGDFAKAYELAETKLRGNAQTQVMSRICVTAADSGNLNIATRAYACLTTEVDGRQRPVAALLALHIRQGDISAAQRFWIMLTTVSNPMSDMVQPTAMYSMALLKSGQIEEGLMEARSMFSRIRIASVNDGVAFSEIREQVNEVLDLFGRVLLQMAAVIPPQAAMTFLWAMVENGGLVTPLVEHVIASLGPAGISQLRAEDLALALQVQANLFANHSTSFDVAHPIRFAHMLDIALSTDLPIDAHTRGVVDRAVAKLIDSRPDMVKRWNDYIVSTAKQPSLPERPGSSFSASTAVTPPSPESIDPYAHATDFRGSAFIVDELERTSGRPEAHLNEALVRFRNMRRIGRHPRYVTYAKLITAAAKCDRAALVHEIVGIAERDVPLIPWNNVVKHGWVSILDAMVAACLTLGDRGLAAKYHQELLELGSAPSANTFGLYITTLKESTKTFDEATEALKIFHRAVAEGVEPTSFLYNALIGKLGKARRIDDCLLYFAQMRANGVRPTSVTYGTVVNALCRVSDERFAEEMFEEMESMPNYKPRPAPYNSMIQYFLNTKRDRSKVLAYYERMRSRNIEPTMHTYKLLIDAYASLEPVDMDAAEKVLDAIKSANQHPESVHYASLVHAKGCVLHDMDAARKVFDSVLSNPKARLQPCLYQALFEAMVANHKVADTAEVLKGMAARKVEITAYIANTLIHGWATEGNIANARAIYDSIGTNKREPSTYEAMTRAYLAMEDRESASRVVQEMLSRGYPTAVASKILDLVGGGAPVTI